MTVRVRPFADRDYVAFSRIHSLAEGIRLVSEDARAVDARWDWSRYERVRVVAVDEEDAPIGYGEIYHEPARFEPRRYFVRLAVEPRLRRRGVGAAIWGQLAAELAERDAVVADLWARDHTACVDFITKRGFREVVRAYRQVRAVATAPLPTPATRERLSTSGVRIASLAELALSDDAAPAKAHELHSASRLDQPSLGPVTAVPFETWKAYNVDDPLALPRAYFVAVAEGTYVGQCTGRRVATADDVLEIGVTGVRPEHRRRGVGRALKLELHAYARANGFREIHTSTARENVAMVELNTSLGYAIVESWGGYELAIPSSP